jgi:hypothetical protein
MHMRVEQQMKKWSSYAGAALVVGFAACKHEPVIAPEEPFVDDGGGVVIPVDTTPVITCDPDSVYFVQDILPLMISSCANPDCHDAIDPEEGIRLYDYAHIIQHVEPGDPGNSEILEDGIWETGDDQMPPNDPLTAAELDLIVTWIEQGALNNSCQESFCDTSNVTYMSTVAPILAAKCNGCHSGANPQGSVLTNSWAAANALATNGSLAAVIQHQEPMTPMPLVGPMLPACQIDQILIWIADGAPNN